MAIADRVAVMNKGKIEQVAHPPELYDSPATAFSASFVGNRNALELPVANGKVAFGSCFSVPAPAGATSSAIAFFRPEDVQISSNGGGQRATIENKLFLGSATRLYLVIENGGQPARIYADLASRQALSLEQGASVGVSIDAATVQVFPAN
jgi:putative spermidine/putrescine transport system ATP-binding protein